MYWWESWIPVSFDHSRASCDHSAVLTLRSCNVMTASLLQQSITVMRNICGFVDAVTLLFIVQREMMVLRLIHSHGIRIFSRVWDIDWLASPFCTRVFKCRLGLPQSQYIVGSCGWREFLPFFTGLWQYPCTALTAGRCLPLALCKRTVKGSMMVCTDAGSGDRFTKRLCAALILSSISS